MHLLFFCVPKKKRHKNFCRRADPSIKKDLHHTIQVFFVSF